MTSTAHRSALLLSCFLAAGLGFGAAMMWRAYRAEPEAPPAPQLREPAVSLADAPELLRLGLEDPATAFPVDVPAVAVRKSEATDAAPERTRTRGPVASAHTDWGPPPRGKPEAVERLGQARTAGFAALASPAISDARHPAQDARLDDLFARMQRRPPRTSSTPPQPESEGGDR